MNIKPLGDKVLVKRKEAEEVAGGGIIIPDTAKEKPMEADVISLGTGRKTTDGKLIPFDVKVGDTVIYAKYSGTTFKTQEKEILILKESDILAIIE